MSPHSDFAKNLLGVDCSQISEVSRPGLDWPYTGVSGHTSPSGSFILDSNGEQITFDDVYAPLPKWAKSVEYKGKLPYRHVVEEPKRMHEELFDVDLLSKAAVKYLVCFKLRGQVPRTLPETGIFKHRQPGWSTGRWISGKSWFTPYKQPYQFGIDPAKPSSDYSWCNRMMVTSSTIPLNGLITVTGF